MNIDNPEDSRGRGGPFFNSALRLLLAMQKRTHYPGYQCSGLTSALSYRSDSDRNSWVLSTNLWCPGLSLATNLVVLVERPIDSLILILDPKKIEYF